MPHHRYVTGECNYGGRVTDDKDRLLLNTILTRCYCPDIVASPAYKLSPSGLYYAPPEGPRQAYLDYIDTLPIAPAPEAFGLHENADITKDLNSTNQVLASLLATSGGAAGGEGGAAAASATEERVAGLVSECLARLPPDFDLEAVQRKYPVMYEESMNTVLVQVGARAVGCELPDELLTPVCSVQCAVCSVQCAVCSVQCAVCSVQTPVCSVQTPVCSLPVGA